MYTFVTGSNLSYRYIVAFFYDCTVFLKRCYNFVCHAPKRPELQLPHIVYILTISNWDKMPA